MSSLALCLGAAAFIAVLPARTQPAGTVTLNELLTRAAENNRNLLALRQRMDEARGFLRQAGIRPAPTLEVSGASGRPLGTVGEEQFGAAISREFETAGKRSKRLQAAEKQLDIAASEYNEGIRQLRHEILVKYAEYLANERRQMVLDDLTDINRRSLELTRKRVEKGDAAVLEQNLIMVEISRAEAQRSTLSGRLAAARSDISRLAGLESSEAWAPTPPAIPSTIPLPGLAARALDQRPDLQLLRLTQLLGEAETALAEAEARPNLTISAGYSRVEFQVRRSVRPDGHRRVDTVKRWGRYPSGGHLCPAVLAKSESWKYRGFHRANEGSPVPRGIPGASDSARSRVSLAAI